MKIPNWLIVEEYSEYEKTGKEYLRSHDFSLFCYCPELYNDKQLGRLTDQDRPDLALGRAGHTLILEGAKKFQKLYHVGGEINTKTGKPFSHGTKKQNAYIEENGIEKPLIFPSEAKIMGKCRVSVLTHEKIKEFLSTGIAETTVRTEYKGVKLQVRIDWFNGVYLLDLKTTKDLDKFKFDARKYNYEMQAFYYHKTVLIATGLYYPICVFAVEKKHPFRSGYWLISDDRYESLEIEFDQQIDKLKECRARNIWPTGFEEARYFD